MLSKHSTDELKSGLVKFKFFYKLPNDTQVDIIRNLSLKDLANFASSSKELKSLAIESKNPDYEDIVKGQILLNNAPEKIRMYVYERLAYKLPPVLGGRSKVSLEGDSLDQFYIEKLEKDENINLLIALGKGFITVDKLEFVTVPWLKAFCTNNVMTAFKNNLVCASDNIEYFTIPSMLRNIFSENGLTGLREKLFTVRDLKYFNNVFWLSDILTDNGIIALRENLITIKQMMSIIPSDLSDILTNNGLQRLRDGLRLAPNMQLL